MMGYATSVTGKTDENNECPVHTYTVKLNNKTLTKAGKDQS
jgi:hypothetical protein